MEYTLVRQRTTKQAVHDFVCLDAVLIAYDDDELSAYAKGGSIPLNEDVCQRAGLSCTRSLLYPLTSTRIIILDRFLQHTGGAEDDGETIAGKLPPLSSASLSRYAGTSPGTGLTRAGTLQPSNTEITSPWVGIEEEFYEDNIKIGRFSKYGQFVQTDIKGLVLLLMKEGYVCIDSHQGGRRDSRRSRQATPFGSLTTVSTRDKVGRRRGSGGDKRLDSVSV
ncbi:uncharacterized protein UHOD_11779 [Ustilago sp. UG-2017b]|nr:uncharacterized protein UHOD_11779 [Ustilago sp. UG-2017b]